MVVKKQKDSGSPPNCVLAGAWVYSSRKTGFPVKDYHKWAILKSQGLVARHRVVCSTGNGKPVEKCIAIK